MSGDLSNAPSFHLIVKLPRGILAGWESGGWVAVESFVKERDARDRFNALRPALEGLHAAAAMIRGLAQSATQTVAHDKTVISREAEFWTLRSAEIRIAGKEILGLWRREVDRLLAEDAAKEAAKEAARQPLRPAPKAGMSRRSAALMFGGSFVAMIVVTKLALPLVSPDPTSQNSLVKRDGTTILVPDPKDPNFTIEYELKPDGSRTVIARFPKGQRPEPQESAEAKRPRTFAEGVNMFLRIRQ